MTRIYEKFAPGSFSSYRDFKDNYKVNVPVGFNYGFDVLDVLGVEKPDQLALLWTNLEGEEKRFSFSDIMRLSNKTANYLRSQGLKKGDKVMLILKRHYQFWYTIIALHKLGIVAIPATHLLVKKDLVYRNNAADITAVISTNEGQLSEQIELAREESPSLKKCFIIGGPKEGWEDFDAGVKAASDVLVRGVDCEKTNNDDMMLMYFTSGTTGMPKMVAHDFTYPLAHIVTAVYWHQAVPEGLHMTVAETGWAKAVWGKLYGQWLAETAIFVYDFDRFIAKDLLTMISKYKVTTFCAPPTIYRFMIQEDFSQYDLSALRYATTAGEALNPEVFNRFFEATGLKLHEGFGQTELTALVATYPWMTPRPGSMGLPSPGYDVDILNDDGQPCRAGEIGQLVVRTGDSKPLGLFMGYYKDPELTKKMWHDGIYYTGDTVWRDEQGYLWFESRADDVIKSSGYRIGPFEVESVLLQHPAVLEAAVTGVEDPLRGIVVKATIVLTDGYTPGDTLVKELQQFVKKMTAPYKYPRVIEFVDALPKTISGKIRRVDLKK